MCRRLSTLTKDSHLPDDPYSDTTTLPKLESGWCKNDTMEPVQGLTRHGVKGPHTLIVLTLDSKRQQTPRTPYHGSDISTSFVIDTNDDPKKDTNNS